MKGKNTLMIILGAQMVGLLLLYIFSNEDARKFVFFLGVMCYLCQITMLLTDILTQPPSSGNDGNDER